MLTSRVAKVIMLIIGIVDVIRLRCRLVTMRYEWYTSEELAVPRELSRTVTEAKRSSVDNTDDDGIF